MQKYSCEYEYWEICRRDILIILTKNKHNLYEFFFNSYFFLKEIYLKIYMGRCGNKYDQKSRIQITDSDMEAFCEQVQDKYKNMKCSFIFFVDRIEKHSIPNCMATFLAQF